MLNLIPVSLSEANSFVTMHHRTHKPVTGHKFSIGCTENGRLVGVAIVGRPVSRYLDDGLTLEVNRLCKRLQLPLWGRVAGGAGYGLSENHHLHSRHRKRRKPAGRWLGLCGAGWRQTLDGKPPPRRRSIPTADEISLRKIR